MFMILYTALNYFHTLVNNVNYLEVYIMYAVCIDTGTTNTRICIRDEETIYSIVKRNIGVRITSIEGNNSTLIATISTAYKEALQEAHITEADVTIILASGMISSNLGLLEIPHLIAPINKTDLAFGITSMFIPEISNVHSIHFIPGVRNNYDITTCNDPSLYAQIDMMRGEEVEAFGVLDLEPFQTPAILILTGSHTKFVFINDQNEIESCLTTMAGETLMQFTKSTIISQSLNYSFADNIDSEYLLAGAKTCQELGLTRASFCVRSLEQFSNATINQRENFLLGAVLEEDLRSINGLSDTSKYNFIVCGSGTLGNGFYTLLKNQKDTAKKTYSASGKTMTALSSYGCILVAKHAKLI